MPIIKDEQKVKRDSQFLKYSVGENGNSLILKSHLYKVDGHFLNSVKRSVICKGDECSYCQKGFQKRSEFNYMVLLNGETGFIDIKPSVFFAIQGISKAQKKDIRQISWTVIKTGEGLKTEYTTSKDDNLDKETFDKAMTEIDENTEKLSQVMTKHENQLIENYSMYEASTKKALSQTDEEIPTPDDIVL